MKYIPKVGDFFIASTYLNPETGHTDALHSLKLLRAARIEGNFVYATDDGWPLDTRYRSFVCANDFPEAQAILRCEDVAKADAAKKADAERKALAAKVEASARERQQKFDRFIQGAVSQSAAVSLIMAKPSDTGVHPTLVHLGRGFVPAKELLYLQTDADGTLRRF